MLSEKLRHNNQIWRHLLNNFDWEETREGVNRESQARILLLGLVGAGKSTLFNQLCGWTVSRPTDLPVEGTATSGGGPVVPIEDFGLFCLVDLSPNGNEDSRLEPYGNLQPVDYFSGYHHDDGSGPDLGVEDILPLDALSPLELAEGADLLVYVLDGSVGVQATDYRWVGRLRRLGVPLLVVLNKSDLIDEVDMAARRAEIEARLATTVLPVSALTGSNVKDELLAKMINLCPQLTVALGRELSDFRHQAAERLIRRTALLNGLVAFEPVPLIDLPVQIITLTGLMLRIAAVYDRPPTDVRRREVVVAVAGGLAGRYGGQQLAKLVPLIGWLVSSVIAWSTTWTLGRAAVAYFEAGGDAVVDRGWRKTKGKISRIYQSLDQRWQRLPRLQVRWVQAEPDSPNHKGGETA